MGEGALQQEVEERDGPISYSLEVTIALFFCFVPLIFLILSPTYFSSSLTSGEVILCVHLRRGSKDKELKVVVHSHLSEL
jgi:hypothetical protein